MTTTVKRLRNQATDCAKAQTALSAATAKVPELMGSGTGLANHGGQPEQQQPADASPAQISSS